MLGMILASAGVISPLSDHHLTITFRWINVPSNSLYGMSIFWWCFPNKFIFTEVLLLRMVELKPVETLQSVCSCTENYLDISVKTDEQNTLL